jgi:7,8-dihydro-6-hydroxymethylpterin-pyrophosphokinase (HPPK)
VESSIHAGLQLSALYPDWHHNQRKNHQDHQDHHLDRYLADIVLTRDFSRPATIQMALFCNPSSSACKHIVSICRNFKVHSHAQSTSTRRQSAVKTKDPFNKSTRRALVKPFGSASTGPEKRRINGKIATRHTASSSSTMTTTTTTDTAKQIEQSPPPQHSSMHRAMIALGSNIGDRVGMIEQACEKMPARAIIVKRTSFLYETAPMYVTDQNTFLNGVCEVRS